MYELKYSKEATKMLAKLPKNLVRTIVTKLEILAKDPYSKLNNALKLKGVDGYRLRVGDWRVFYTVEDKTITIWVMDIQHRGSAYQ